MGTFEKKLQELRDNHGFYRAHAPAGKGFSMGQFFDPVFGLIQRLIDAEVVFPGEYYVPSVAALRQRLSDGRHYVLFRISPKAQLCIQAVVTEGMKPEFRYRGFVTREGIELHLLITDSLETLESWLATVVSEYEVITSTPKQLVNESTEPEGRTRLIDLDG